MEPFSQLVAAHLFRVRMCAVWCFQVDKTIDLEETKHLTYGSWLFVLTLGMVYFTPIWKYIDDHMIKIVDTSFFSTLWDTIQFEHSGVAKILTKSGFEDTCRKHNFPVPESYTLDTLPQDRKVWCKSDTSACGNGHFIYDPKTDQKPTDPTLTLQEILVPHPTLAKLISHAHMPTFRLTTYSVCGGKPKCVSPYILRVAPPGSLLDNDHSKKGRILLFANEDGQFKEAFSYPEAELVREMPNGVDYKKIQIPFWKQMVELVEKAHSELLPDVCVLGWDVACTPTGPKLVEVNNCNPVLGLWNQKVNTEIKIHMEDHINWVLKSKLSNC